MDVREKVISEVSVLNEGEVKQVSQFPEFIKFQTKKRGKKTNGKQKDSIFNLGKKPVEVGISDASENLDKYLD
jgi:hypothetical protein